MPLLFDMPRAELDKYDGTNPRPDDFDLYWDRALAQLSALTRTVEMTPAEFQTPFASCAHLWFEGTAGARLHAKLIRPRSVTEPHPAVLKFHGYSGRSPDWTELLAYPALGYTVAALDCRGQGGLSEDVGGVKGWTLRSHLVRGLDDHPDKLYYRHVFLDCVLLARILMDMDDVDSDRVAATGMSQGGGLALACAALEPRIRRAAPVLPFLCDYRRVWELDLVTDPYYEIVDWFRRFDPLHEREDELFTRLGYIDVQHLAPRIQADVFMTVSLGDRTCPPSTQFACFNKIRSAKSLRVYPDFGHEQLPGSGDAIFEFLTRL